MASSCWVPLPPRLPAPTYLGERSHPVRVLQQSAGQLPGGQQLGRQVQGWRREGRAGQGETRQTRKPHQSRTVSDNFGRKPPPPSWINNLSDSAVAKKSDVSTNSPIQHPTKFAGIQKAVADGRARARARELIVRSRKKLKSIQQQTLQLYHRLKAATKMVPKELDSRRGTPSKADEGISSAADSSGSRRRGAEQNYRGDEAWNHQRLTRTAPAVRVVA